MRQRHLFEMEHFIGLEVQAVRIQDYSHLLALASDEECFDDYRIHAVLLFARQGPCSARWPD